MSRKYSLCSAVPCFRWKFFPSSKQRGCFPRDQLPACTQDCHHYWRKLFGSTSWSQRIPTSKLSNFQGNTQLLGAELTRYFRAALPLTTLTSQRRKKKILFMRNLMVSHPPCWSLSDTSMRENCMDNFGSRGSEVSLDPLSKSLASQEPSLQTCSCIRLHCCNTNGGTN